MKERPILFSGEMVRAILDGRKTMTRRVVKPKYRGCDLCLADGTPHNATELQDENGVPNVAGGLFGTAPYLRTGFCEHNDCIGERIRCPYGDIGDRLWVREAFSVGYSYPKGRENGEKKYHYSYKAAEEMKSLAGVFICGTAKTSDYKTKADLHVWKSPIFMPRSASRITLEITDVRVERLQAISEEDAKAEGVPVDDEPCDHTRRSCEEISCLGPGYRSSFCTLWSQINGKKHPWDSNPWLWVISFRVVQTAQITDVADTTPSTEQTK